VQQLIKELPTDQVRAIEARVGATGEPVWQHLAEFRLLDDAILSIKANLVPYRVAEFVAELVPLGFLVQAHAQNGIVIGHATSALTAERARTMLKELQGLAAGVDGNLVVLRCPPEWKATLPIWGAARGDLELMRAVKAKLDPGNLFNPGRYLV
jgi:glycolate oxidase FAD binding subunit